MSTPLDGIRPTERPTSIEQIRPPAPASSAGIGESPSSLCCLGGDANDSIFSRIWTTITSFISSLWAWLTGLCFGGETAIPPAVAAASAQRPRALLTQLQQDLVGNAQTSLTHLFHEGVPAVESDQCKVVLVFQLGDQIIAVVPRSVNAATNSESFRSMEREGLDALTGALAACPVTERSYLNITLMLIENVDDRESLVRHENFCQVTPREADDDPEGDTYETDYRLIDETYLNRDFEDWEQNADAGETIRWAREAGIEYEPNLSQRDHLLKWIRSGVPAQDPASSHRAPPPLIGDIQESFNVLFDPARYSLQTNDCRQVLAFEVDGHMLLPTAGVMSSVAWNSNKLVACHQAEALEAVHRTANSTARSVLALMEDRGEGKWVLHVGKAKALSLFARLNRTRGSPADFTYTGYDYTSNHYTSNSTRLEALDRQLRELFRDCPLSDAMIAYLKSGLSQKIYTGVAQ